MVGDTVVKETENSENKIRKCEAGPFTGGLCNLRQQSPFLVETEFCTPLDFAPKTAKKIILD